MKDSAELAEKSPSALIDVNFQDFGTNFSRHLVVWTNSLSSKVPVK